MNINKWLNYSPEMDQLSEKTQKLIEKVSISTTEFVKASRELSKTNFFTRAAHAKTYMSVEAKFSPNQKALENLGITNYFKEDSSVLIRFSNANNVIVPEKSNFPAYGMSLKFENNINYPLVNFPLFPTDDVDAFLQLFNELNEARIAQTKSGWDAIKELPSLVGAGMNMLFHVNPLRLGNIMWKGAQLRNQFILNYAYHGIGCYRFGNYVAKIHTQPQQMGNQELDMEEGLQKDLLQSILKSQEISFNIILQIATDENDTPINILSKEWSSEDAQMLELGTVTIPIQKVVVESVEIENMSFSPFHNPLELQPVGRIQQTRKQLYEVSQKTRNELNNQLKE